MSKSNGDRKHKRKTDDASQKHKDKGWISRAVRDHNYHPGIVTRFLRANATPFCFAAILFGLVKHYLHNGGFKVGLPYPVKQADGTILYDHGLDDLYFILNCVFALTLGRAFFLELIVTRMTRCMKIKSEEIVKFQDQAWQGFYYATAWCCGFAIMWSKRDDWGFQISKLTASFPDKLIEWDMKLYYMMQCSFWLHSIVVQTMEMWRKDFVLYYIHHIITSCLCIGSYYKCATRIGFFILVEQDFADIFLPIAKLLNYANWEPASTIAFASFAVVWIPTRHVLYNMFLVEIWYMDLSGEAGEYLSFVEWTGFFIFLSILQLLLIIWLKDLVMAIYKVLSPDHVRMVDHRSGDEMD